MLNSIKWCHESGGRVGTRCEQIASSDNVVSLVDQDVCVEVRGRGGGAREGKFLCFCDYCLGLLFYGLGRRRRGGVEEEGEVEGRRKEGRRRGRGREGG